MVIFNPLVIDYIILANGCQVTHYFSQQKSIEYIRCFHDVNEMVHIINTIINIPLILYHVFYR